MIAAAAEEVVVAAVAPEKEVVVVVVVVLDGTTSSKICLSTLNISLCRTYNCEKFLVPYSPLRIGSTNSSHILSAMDLNWRMFREVDLARDSQIVPRKRV